MKVYTNDALVDRKRKIAGASSLLGFGILLVAIFLSFREQYVVYAWFGAAFGLIVSLVGTYHVNRWVRPPVAEKILEKVLKRLDRRYFLYNYIGPVAHLLLTPSGLIAIVVKRYEGDITCNDDSWKGSFSVRRLYTRGLTAESLGNPTKDAEDSREKIRKWLRENVAEYGDDIPVDAVVLFLNKDSIELKEMDGCSVDVAFPDDLRKVLNKSVLSTLPDLSTPAYKAVRRKLNELAHAGEDDDDE